MFTSPGPLRTCSALTRPSIFVSAGLLLAIAAPAGPQPAPAQASLRRAALLVAPALTFAQEEPFWKEIERFYDPDAGRVTLDVSTALPRSNVVVDVYDNPTMKQADLALLGRRPGRRRRRH